jgi:putative NIF3 family GTP cyclohydrolase 1 type 2
MINLKPSILAALQNDSQLIALLGGPNIYQLRAPKAAQFPRITFLEFANVGAVYADDDEYVSEISIQIDVWTQAASTTAIAQRVDVVMKSMGFLRTESQDLYEDDSDIQIFHKAMRYVITQDFN